MLAWILMILIGVFLVGCVSSIIMSCYQLIRNTAQMIGRRATWPSKLLNYNTDN